MTDREAFEAGIKDDPLNQFRRDVFSDWLLDHDEPEEADRQRKWIKAYAWLNALASRIGLIYEDLMVGVHNYVSDGSAWYVGPNFAPENELSDEPLCKEMYEHWQTVTGVPVPFLTDPAHAYWDGPFCCDCGGGDPDSCYEEYPEARKALDL